MNSAVPSVRVARLDELEAIPVAGGLYVPLRRTLGVRAFGINAYLAARVGDQLIEKHDETGSGAGGHEEAYLVVSGRALFTVAGEEIDAAAGTVVFVGDVGVTRSAVALEAGTTAIVVGGPADRPLSVSPFECWFVAEGPYRKGDYTTAIEIATAGLEDWPDHPVIHYQLACYHALAGNPHDALDHLGSAIAGDGKLAGVATTDGDFDSLRDEPRFAALLAEGR